MVPTVEQATEVIRAHVEARGGEVWGACTRDEESGEWRATVALRSSGPLVIMGFRLKVAPESTKDDT